MAPRALILLICILLAAATSPAGAEKSSDPGTWTANDLLFAESATGWTLADDGSAAAWIINRVHKVDGEEKKVAELWLYRHGEEPRRLTHIVESISSPTFSPDGKILAFLSNRPRPATQKKPEKGAERQVWALPLHGGEAYPLTSLDRAVSGFAFAGNDALILRARESPTLWEKEKKKGKDTTRIVDDYKREPPVRLYRVALGGADARPLTSNLDRIVGMEVSPDGKKAIVRRSPSLSYAFDQKVPPVFDLVDLETGASEPIFTGEHLPGQLRWLADGSGFVFHQEITSHPTYTVASVNRLFLYRFASKTVEEIEIDWPRGLSGRALYTLGEGFLVQLADGVHRRVSRIEGQSGAWKGRNVGGTHGQHIDMFHLSRDGSLLIYRSSSSTRPPQWFRARVEEDRIVDEVQLTKLNPGYADKPTGRVDVISWTGAQGDTVEGLLQYPLDWQEAGSEKPRPLLVDIHGGPASADRDTWDQRVSGPNLLYRQRGAFVLQVNYHGSSSYGLEWVESIRERYYELEVPDIEMGVDHLIAKGLVDPDQLGIYGWSNGGILSADIITRTGRYKAASIGAADVEWISDWANVDFGASFDNYYFGGPPWEIPQVYIDKSPFFRLTEVTTPTLIHTGTEDRNVPTHQSWSLFRALQQIGKTEARLALYPGEAHGLRKIPHQRRKVEEDLAWFDRFLFGQEAEDRDALKKDSPLALLLERQAARSGSTGLGLAEDGILVPETVPMPGVDELAGLEVGRFELTRAQASSLDPSLSLAGPGDFPAGGLTFSQAKALVARLSKVTGKSYRLPTQAEARAMAAAAGSGGNTLVHWAGYRPNPEDKAQIRSLLEGLEGDAPLLLRVGQLAGHGREQKIYDLDGNVAEWAIGENGQGVPVGASADRVGSDSASAPANAYVGVRVILE